MIGPALKLVGEELYVVADDTTYGRLYDHLAAARASQNIFVIGWRNLRGMFKVLRDNKNLVLFCDGGYRRGDVPVELCGEPTTLPIGPATLAAKTGAPLLAVACRRTDDDRFVTRGLPLIHCAGTDPVEIQRATQAVADELVERHRRGPRTVVHVPAGLAPDRCGPQARRRGTGGRAARRGLDEDRHLMLRLALEVADRIVAVLPAGAAYALADFAGDLWYRLAPERRRLVAANLARVCAATGRPTRGPEFAALVHSAFRNHARYYVELLRAPHYPDRSDRRARRGPRVGSLPAAAAARSRDAAQQPPRQLRAVRDGDRRARACGRCPPSRRSSRARCTSSSPRDGGPARSTSSRSARPRARS